MEKTKIKSNSHVMPNPLKVGDSTIEAVNDYLCLRETNSLVR